MRNRLLFDLRTALTQIRGSLEHNVKLPLNGTNAPGFTIGGETQERLNGICEVLEETINEIEQIPADRAFDKDED